MGENIPPYANSIKVKTLIPYGCQKGLEGNYSGHIA
jgi:hypothetical protein